MPEEAVPIEASALGLTPIPCAQSCDPSTSRPIPLMLWLAVGHSVSAVPLQGPFCHHHPFLSQVSQPPPLFLLPTIRLLTPCRHAPVHPATSPSEDSQAPVPAGFAPVLPSASPQESLPKTPVSARQALFPRPLCLLGLPLCLWVPFPWPLYLAGVPLCTPPFLRSQFPFTVIFRAHRPQRPVPGL